MAHLAVYPDPDAETTTCDGSSRNSNSNWTTCRNATTGSTATANSSTHYISTGLEVSTYNIYPFFCLFNTSAIGDDETISAAVLSVYRGGDNSNNQNLSVSQTSPASNTDITTADFNDRGHLGSEGSSRSSFGNDTTAGYVDLTLNSTGRGWISKTGVSKLGLVGAEDWDNSAPAGNKYTQLRTAEYAGTSNDPILVVISGTSAGSAFYPDPSPESATVDGLIQGRSNVWSTARGTSPTNIGVRDSSTSDEFIHTGYDPGGFGGYAYTLNRTFTLFDTAAIDDGDTISSAVVSIYVGSDFAGGNVTIQSSNISSKTAVTTGDWSSMTVNSPTEFITRVNISALTNNAYNDFTLNASGIAAVSKTGITELCWRDGASDVDNVAPTDNSIYFDARFADYAGTASDPYLLVLHSSGATTNSGFFNFM
jgi:hypothetical protein